MATQVQTSDRSLLLSMAQLCVPGVPVCAPAGVGSVYVSREFLSHLVCEFTKLQVKEK